MSQIMPSIAARQAPTSISKPLTEESKVVAVSAAFQSNLDEAFTMASTSTMIVSNHPAAFTVELALVPTLKRMSASFANCPASAIVNLIKL